MKKIFLLIIFTYLFIKIDGYCEGSHNRVDLNKKECARYEIEKEEIDGDNVNDYECCFISHLLLDGLVEDECLIQSKDKTERAIIKLAELSPLNIFDTSIECSFKYLTIFNIKIQLLCLLLILL